MNLHSSALHNSRHSALSSPPPSRTAKRRPGSDSRQTAGGRAGDGRNSASPSFPSSLREGAARHARAERNGGRAERRGGERARGGNGGDTAEGWREFSGTMKLLIILHLFIPLMSQCTRSRRCRGLRPPDMAKFGVAIRKGAGIKYKY